MKDSSERKNRDDGDRTQVKGMPSVTLTEALDAIVNTDENDGPSIGRIVDTVGDKGFGVVFLLLSLPSALPVPAPGYSTPFGIVIVLIALQMFVGRHVLWLPERLRKIRMSQELADKVLDRGTGVIRWMEKYVRPRQQWISSTWGLRILALVILSMGSLMILPIPLTNTAPAMVIFLIGLGLAEDDGLLAIGSFAVGCVAVALYGYIVYLFYAYGESAVVNLKTSVKNLIGW